MKKFFVVVAAACLVLCACSDGAHRGFEYKGLSMDLPFKVFCDSLASRGFAVDSARSDSAGSVVVMRNPGEKFTLILGQTNDTLRVVRENYEFSTNDSTRQLWQEIRDAKEKELGTWPNCPMLKDDHKIAKFETDGGFLTVTLENTYTPKLYVTYEKK